MIIYEYANSITNTLYAFFMGAIATGLMAIMIIMFPVLKKAVEVIYVLLKHKEKGNGMCKQQKIAIIMFAMIVYGISICGVAFSSRNLIEAVKSNVNLYNSQTVSGNVTITNTDKIEYRGELVGYEVQFEINGDKYCVDEPPGLSYERLEKLKETQWIKIEYAEIGDKRVVTKIEIMDINKIQNK